MEADRFAFILCACGKHGTFRNGNGVEGPDVASKEEAISFLDAGMFSGRFSTSEIEVLLRRVQSSPMAIEKSDVPPLLMTHVRDWECMRRVTNGKLSFNRFHELLDEIRPT